jgi:putative transposase
VEVLAWTGIVRYSVFFLIELSTRRVEVGGIVREPAGLDGQVARNVTDAFSGFLRGKRWLVVDRDPVYTEGLARIFKQAGVALVRTPPHSPNLNAFAERWVRSIREQCLSRIFPLGEAGLRRAVQQFIEHYKPLTTAQEPRR